MDELLYSVDLPFLLPSVNTNNQRDSKWNRITEKLELKEKAGTFLFYELRERPCPLITDPVYLKYTLFVDHAKRDTENVYCKFVTDCLKPLKVLVDDRCKYVRESRIRIEY